MSKGGVARILDGLFVAPFDVFDPPLVIAEKPFLDLFQGPGLRFFFLKLSQGIGPVDAPGVEHPDANGVFRAKERATHAHDAAMAEADASLLVEGDVPHGAKRDAGLARDATAFVDPIEKRIDETP